VPLLEPAGIEKDAADVRLPEVLRVTITPPALAGPLSVTVQVSADLGPSDKRLQAMELMVTAGVTVTVPATPATATAPPEGFAPIAELTPKGTANAPERVAETVAITPLAIALLFMPTAMQE
jgi:hypothetical protein